MTDVSILGFLVILFALLYIVSMWDNKKRKADREVDECNHFWELTDKWSDDKKTYHEFYCKSCLEIVTTEEKYKGDEESDERKDR